MEWVEHQPSSEEEMQEATRLRPDTEEFRREKQGDSCGPGASTLQQVNDTSGGINAEQERRI